jgi:hypothetical protein
VRDAKKEWLRGSVHNAEELSDTLAAPDDTMTHAAVHEAAEQMLARLSPTGREVLELIAEGRTRAEIVARGYSARQYNDTRTQVRKVRHHLSETGNLRALLRAGVTPASADSDERESEVVAIEFAPHEGQECPPCHRCKWFEGYMPVGRRTTRMDVVEPDIREAIENIEREKLRIATEVRYLNKRNGSWQALKRL